jgi:predicted 3-demethylubiquinone-9 3-methyltransferase (glyoxalase superfamily)
MDINYQPITPCLWFNNQAEEAVNFYLSIFPESKINGINRYGKEGFEIHHMAEGTVMTIEFEINGQPFTALNGGPIFTFTEAISFQIFCKTQEEVDRYWEKLGKSGDEKAQQCGWLKDKFGVSWQVIPKEMSKYISGPDSIKSGRAMRAMLQMKKLDLYKLKEAYEGKMESKV